MEEKTGKCSRLSRFFAATFLLCAMFLFGLPGGVKQVQAASAELKSAISKGSGNLILEVKLDTDGNSVNVEEWEIYRANKNPDEGGIWKLVDVLSWRGHGGFHTDENGWYTKSNNGKLYCVVPTGKSGFPEVNGTVTIYDSTVKIGEDYYYQIRYLPKNETVIQKSNTLAVSANTIVPNLLKSCSVDGKTVKLVWGQMSNAKGYQIYRKEGKTWKKIKTIKKKTTTTYTDKTTKTGKMYRYKVRAYNTLDGKTVYSAFSEVQKVSLVKPTVKGNYNTGSVYGPALDSNKLTQVRRVVQSFKDNYIKAGMSDYQKVLAAYEYIRGSCGYAWGGWQYNGANTAWGALVYGEAQCSGYARGMKALCDAIGIQCQYVHANSKASNPSHQWNQVKVDGKWYIVDAQSGAFLWGSKNWNALGMRWNTNGLATCSKTNHKNAF